MNPFNKFFLWLVLTPRTFYEKWGIDNTHLKSILSMKLIMDDRRPNTLQAGRQSKSAGKAINYATIWTVILSAFMGCMFLFPFALGNDYITHLTIFFTMYIIMLSMMLVSDFTSVLIDVQDNNIILPKPINDRTFLAARLLHIVIHICKLSLPMLTPCFIYLGIKKGWPAALFFLPLALLTILLCIFLINAIYILILRITTTAKFKNIISYFQIVFAIVIYAGFQVFSRDLSPMMQDMSLADKDWLILAPPYWFACAFNMATTGAGSNMHSLATLLAFIFPLLSIYLVIKYLAPAFNQKLAMISGGETQSPVTPGVERKSKPKGRIATIASWLTFSPAENAGLLFTWSMMTRSREYKIKVYPSIGYMFVLIFLPFFTGKRSFHSYTEDGELSYFPVAITYSATLILLPALVQILFSEKFKATWMFWVTPIAHPGEIINGAIKAVLLQFLFPMSLIFLGLGYWISGPAILPDLALALCNQVMIFYLMAVMMVKSLPFSLPVSEQAKGRNGMMSVVVLMVGGLIAGLQYFLFQKIWLVAICLALSLIAIWVLMQEVKTKTLDFVELE